MKWLESNMNVRQLISKRNKSDEFSGAFLWSPSSPGGYKTLHTINFARYTNLHTINFARSKT